VIAFSAVRWRNFMSTGNHFTEMRLDEYTDTLVIGPNGSGKSTMLDALCFGLFGKPFRNVKRDQLVNSINERDCVVEVDFTSNGRKCTVSRGISPNFLRIVVDGIERHHEGSVKEVQSNFEQNILKLDMKIFTQVVVLGASSYIPFMQLPTHIRRDVIEDVLDIKVFSVMASILRDTIVIHNVRVLENSRNADVVKAQLDAERERVRRESVAVDEEVSKYKAELDAANVALESTMGIIEKIDANIASLTQSVADFTEETRKTYNELYKLDEKLREKNCRLGDRMKFFSNTSICPTCDQSIDELVREKRIKHLGDKTHELDVAVSKIGVDLKSLAAICSKYDDVMQEVAKLGRKKYEYQVLVKGQRREIDFIAQKMADVVKRVGTESHSEVDKLQTQLDSLTAEREQLLNVQMLHEVATIALKDSGIKAKIIGLYVPIINVMVNKYLAAMDFFVKFELNETFEERILSRHRDAFTYDSFSEGERMRIDLALMFTWRAIAKAKNSVNTNILVLDEVFDSSLDSVGCDEFMKLLKSLENTNAFVISHRGDTLLDRFKNVVRFEKNANFSRMVP